MHCSAFQKKHLAFVDDTLSIGQRSEMRDHLAHCERCGALDHRVRRALIVARNNIPAVQLSADFQDRFAQRMARERTVALSSSSRALRAVSLWAVAASGVVALGFGAYGRLRPSQPEQAGTITAIPPYGFDVRRTPDQMTTGLVTSVSTGFPIVPALLLAEESAAPSVGALRPAFQQVVARQ